jgi:hypothetical protein
VVHPAAFYNNGISTEESVQHNSNIILNALLRVGVYFFFFCCCCFFFFFFFFYFYYYYYYYYYYYSGPAANPPYVLQPS